MSTRRTVGLVAVLAVVAPAVGILLAGAGAASTTTAQEQGKKDETKIVPRESVFSSSNQPDATLVDGGGGLKPEALKRYDGIRRLASRIGPSNVFLVQGRDLAQAIDCTEGAFAPLRASYANGEEPFGPAKGGREMDVWVVAYLGVMPSDGYVLKRVEQTGQRIRVVYRNGGATLGDTVTHLFWARLGRLPSGKYTVELYEEKAGEAVLTRLVRIPE